MTTHNGQDHPSPNIAPNDVAALKAILRLKAGLSPLNRLADTTVDYAKHIGYLESLHDTCLSTGNALGVVTGPYGTGKTHFLLLSKIYAIDHGYAVAHLSLDMGLSALGHPQRHMRALLASIRVPPRNELLLEHLRYLLDDASGFRLFCHHLQEIVNENSDISEIAEKAFQYSQLHSSLRQSTLYWYLSGASLIGKAAAATVRLQAYKLLNFWVIFCKRYLNCKGLMIVLDEVEKLFDQFPVSRRAAYRSIACYASILNPGILLCALTPHAWELLLSEIAQESEIILNYSTRLQLEDIRHFSKIVQKVCPHEVSHLSRRGYSELVVRLKRLHSEARGYSADGGTADIIPPAISSEMTPRIFARSIISALEANWTQLS
jgi:hypothetical protein